MPLTQSQLAQRIKQALDSQSNDSNVDPAQARQMQADDIAAAINDFVIGRTATGPTTDGATANVIIQ